MLFRALVVSAAVLVVAVSARAESSTRYTTGDITALNGTVSLELGEADGVAVLLAGTWTATIVAEVSPDKGTTWTQVDFYNPSTNATAASVTATGTYQITNTAGMSNARARASLYTSGTCAVTIRMAGTYRPHTQPVSGTVTANAGTGPFPVSDNSGTLTVDAPVGTPLAARLSDGAAFLTTASGRLSVDGSAVTQPVSGTVTANAGAGTFTVGDGAGALNVIVDSGALTADVGTFPDNEPVDVARMNGVAVTMGNGISGTGVQRVTLASDSTGVLSDITNPINAIIDSGTVTTVTTVTNLTNLPNEGQQTAANSISVTPDTDNDSVSATGAAPPGEATFVAGLASGATGGWLLGITVCDTYVNVTVSTATTALLVTGVSGRHVRICALSLVTAAANNAALISGTGATCGTGTTAMTGGTTAATGWNFAANGGIAQGSGFGEINRTNATGDSVCIVTSAATQLSGRIAYTIY